MWQSNGTTLRGIASSHATDFVTLRRHSTVRKNARQLRLNLRLSANPCHSHLPTPSPLAVTVDSFVPTAAHPRFALGSLEGSSLLIDHFCKDLFRGAPQTAVW